MKEIEKEKLFERAYAKGKYDIDILSWLADEMAKAGEIEEIDSCEIFQVHNEYLAWIEKEENNF